MKTIKKENVHTAILEAVKEVEVETVEGGVGVEIDLLVIEELVTREAEVETETIGEVVADHVGLRIEVNVERGIIHHHEAAHVLVLEIDVGTDPTPGIGKDHQDVMRMTGEEDMTGARVGLDPAGTDRTIQVEDIVVEMEDIEVEKGEMAVEIAVIP